MMATATQPDLTCGWRTADRAADATPRSVRVALEPLRGALFAATIFSLGINLLMLVSPLYLMQVFDRVLAGGNLHTLFWLSAIAIGCLAVYGALEVVRGRILSKIGIWLESEVTAPLIKAGMAGARGSGGHRPHALRELAQLRGFLSGPAIHAVFDAPWAVVFLAVLWSLHSWYGIFALVGAAVLIALAAVGEVLTRRLSDGAGHHQTAALAGAEAALRNAEVVHAMGMTDAILGRWTRSQAGAADQQDRLNDHAVLIGGLSKFIRIAVQTAVIGIGAVLVIKGETTGGGMIAASILLGRALAPVDQAIASWKQIASVRSAWRRVDEALQSLPPEPARIRLPEPKGHLSVEDVSVTLPGAAEPLLRNISFELQPGESLAIVGPSAAGKSLLCRMLSGIIAPSTGHVRIDHADLTAWPEPDLRPHVGYLPQEIALFPGTVGENIARMSDADPRQVVEAAQLANVHELILRLPDGYQTDVGAFGHLLSGGQRQRIGLARAVFGSPRLIILDEPNSNLDPAGEAALLRAIAELKKRCCSVVIVSHKLGIVQSLDKTLLLQEGSVRALGPSDRVLSILMGDRAHEPAATPRHAAFPTTATAS